MGLALNLSDVGVTFLTKDLLLHAIKEAEKATGDKVSEIYIGAYFCEKYLLHFSKEFIQEFYATVCRLDIRIVLVVPIASEKHLHDVKAWLEGFIEVCADRINAITVNDYGMLHYVQNTYSIDINIGRLLYKEVRDCRYSTILPSKKKVAVCSDALYALLREYRIKGLEIEAFPSDIEIENPYGYQVAIHAPLVMATTGRVCEYASISTQIDKKFRVGTMCKRQCALCYSTFKSANHQYYYKIGRSVFFKSDMIDASTLTGTSKIIYFPLGIFEKHYENSCTIK